MTVPTEDLADVRTIYRTLEELGYDRAFSFEAKHDPFVPLAVAGEHTTTIGLGTAVAIAFARTPMTLARPRGISRPSPAAGSCSGSARRSGRTSSSATRCRGRDPAARMRELVAGIRAIWDAWEHGTPLDFRGDFYTHTRMIPAFDPGPNRVRPPADLHRRRSGRR